MDAATQVLPEDKLVNMNDDQDPDWVDEPFDEPPLDAAYLEHIAQMATDERVKRVRPKGVSKSKRDHIQ